jgi:hypothetical protein
MNDLQLFLLGVIAYGPATVVAYFVACFMLAMTRVRPTQFVAEVTLLCVSFVGFSLAYWTFGLLTGLGALAGTCLGLLALSCAWIDR